MSVGGSVVLDRSVVVGMIGVVLMVATMHPPSHRAATGSHGVTPRESGVGRARRTLPG